jgi:hypothetical protein
MSVALCSLDVLDSAQTKGPSACGDACGLAEDKDQTTAVADAKSPHHPDVDGLQHVSLEMRGMGCLA